MKQNTRIAEQLNKHGLSETNDGLFVSTNDNRTITFILNSENTKKSTFTISKTIDSKAATFDLTDIPQAHTLMYLKPDDMTSDEFLAAIQELGNIYESIRL